MRSLLPFFGLMLGLLLGAWGQGMQAYKDHDEDQALQRARALKEMKRSIEGPSSPGPVRIMAGGFSSPQYDRPVPRPGEGGVRYEQMKREPLHLSVVTPEGLVPLTTYHDPGYQSAQAASRQQGQNQGIGRRGESEIKAWRLSLFDRNAKLDGGVAEDPRVQSLAAVAEASPASSSAEVVAIVEETPSAVPGGEPERRILGFLPGNRGGAAGARPVEYRGLQARREPVAAPAAGASPSASTPAPAGRSSKPAKPTQPAGTGEEMALVPSSTEESFTEDDVIARGEDNQRTLLSRWFQRKGDELYATGEEVSLNPASADRQRSFLDSWFGGVRGEPSEEYEIKSVRSRGEQSVDTSALDGAEFVATAGAQSPFHVIDSGPGETYVVDLPMGTVGRTHGSGDQWAWLQLDSGLMGLMRKQHLRPARAPEVQGYLASERAAAGSAGEVAKRKSRSAEGGAVAGLDEVAEMVGEPAEVASGSDAPVPAGLSNAPGETKKPVEYPKSIEEVLKSLE